MDDRPAGHRETQTELPDPVEPAGPWSIGALALPAMTLSVASAAVFMIVWLFLQRDQEMRAFFVLPRLAEASIAAAAALLSWAIVLAGRRRPGRSWPRIWALTLAAASSLVACLVFALPRRSGMDALAVAAMASAFTLAPRLLRLRPDSLLVQKIAPLSLAGTLLIVMPATWAAGHEITVTNQKRVDDLVRHLREWTSAVREISHYDWPHLESDREGGAARVQRLASFDFRGEIDDQAVWQQAVVLRRDRELAESAQALQDALVEALDPARVPRVSSFNEAALHTVDNVWEANLAFPALSETVGKYHYQVGRLLAELGVADRPVANAGLAALEEHSRKKREDLERMMTAALHSWSDGWAVFRLPQHSLIGKAELPLSEMFEMPLLMEEERSLAAGDLWQLTLLPLRVARRLPSAIPSCRRRDEYTAKPPGERLPRTFFRLDCYSYSPQGDGQGAELRAELRLVYRSAPGRHYLPGDSLPVEVWFTLPLPAGETGERYRQAVMTALSNACRKLCPRTVQTFGRSGSSATGFTLHGEGGTVTVLRPAQTSLPGEQKALIVQALRK
jgi:hypothetical protein